jgi:hypothetical protein
MTAILLGRSRSHAPTNSLEPSKQEQSSSTWALRAGLEGDCFPFYAFCCVGSPVRNTARHLTSSRHAHLFSVSLGERAMSALDTGAKILPGVISEAEQLAARAAEALRGDSPLAAALGNIAKADLHLHPVSPSTGSIASDFTIQPIAGVSDRPVTIIPRTELDAAAFGPLNFRHNLGHDHVYPLIADLKLPDPSTSELTAAGSRLLDRGGPLSHADAASRDFLKIALDPDQLIPRAADFHAAAPGPQAIAALQSKGVKVTLSSDEPGIFTIPKDKEKIG